MTRNEVISFQADLNQIPQIGEKVDSKPIFAKFPMPKVN